MIKTLSEQVNFLKFLLHVKKFFSTKNKLEKKNLILAEFNTHKPAIIGILYLLKILKKKHNAKIIVYGPHVSFTFLKYVKRLIKVYIINCKQFLIFKTLGCKFKHLTKFKNDDLYFVEKKYKEILDIIKKKDDIPYLTIEGICIGDLIYDSYTRYNSKPTVDLNDANFKKTILEYLREFYYWLNLIKNNPIKSIVVTHSVYNLAIPLRIAQKYKIPAYMGSINFLSYFDTNRRCLVDNNYKNHYETLSEENKLKALQYSKKKLEIKFNPNEISADFNQDFVIQRDVHWGRLDSFTPIRKTNIFKKNGKPNVVVLAHCFYDAPHNEREWLFADYYEWINHLFKLSKVTDYNWHIKQHPASVNQKLNEQTIEKLVAEFPHVSLLNDVNNSELLADNVSLVLTAWGSPGYEFSYNEVPVILASNICCYSGYNFTYKPKNLQDFDYAIKNFQNIKFNFEKKDIYKYYFNQMLTYWDLYPNYSNYKSGLNSSLAKNDEIFKIWLRDFLEKDHEKNLEDVEGFIVNKKNQLITNKIN